MTLRHAKLSKEHVETDTSGAFTSLVAPQAPSQAAQKVGIFARAAARKG